MTEHLAHAGVWGAIGWSLALFVLGVAVVWAVWSGGGASGRWLAHRMRRPLLLRAARVRRRWRAMRRPHRPAHRARRPHPLLAAVVLAARFFFVRFTIPGGTR